VFNEIPVQIKIKQHNPQPSNLQDSPLYPPSSEKNTVMYSVFLSYETCIVGCSITLDWVKGDTASDYYSIGAHFWKATTLDSKLSRSQKFSCTLTDNRSKANSL